MTTQWSGGSTTQLTIAPAGAVYVDRRFLWRISSATVTIKETDFTALPDYYRLISVLEGEMTLTHNGGEPVLLRPGDVHGFAGGDETRSVGCCTDFNLMLRQGQAEGTVETMSLYRERQECALLPQTEDILIYCVSGVCQITSFERCYTLQPGEALSASGLKSGALSLKSDGEARLMLCQMWRL